MTATGTDIDALNAQLVDFARDWLERELSDAERLQLAAFAAGVAHNGGAPGAAPGPADAARARAAQSIDSGRQRAQDLIQQSLQRTQQTVAAGPPAAVAAAAAATVEAENAVLASVERAQSLQDLRPSAAPAAGSAPPGSAVIGQIAERLAQLVKTEVDACFQRQFGPVAAQLQAALDMARQQGLLAAEEAAGSAAAATGDVAGNAGNTGKNASPPVSQAG